MKLNAFHSIRIPLGGALCVLLLTTCESPIEVSEVDSPAQLAKGGNGKGNGNGGGGEDPPPTGEWTAAHDVAYTNEDGDLVLIDTTGKLEPFRFDVAVALFYSYSWSPGGSLLVELEGEAGFWAIHQNEDGTHGDPQPLFEPWVGGGGYGNQSWSPDGTMIAFDGIMDPGDGVTYFDLFVQPMNRSTEETDGVLRQITNTPAVLKLSTMWGRYSQRVAMTAELPNGTFGVHIYDVVASPTPSPIVIDLVDLIERPGSSPFVRDWARKRDRLAVEAAGDIWIVDFSDPEDIRACNLTPDVSGLRSSSPTWSPDDDWIMFQREHDWGKSKWLRGNDLVKVPVNAGADACMEWEDRTVVSASVQTSRRSASSHSRPRWRR